MEIFVYGTLMDPSVMRAVVGRVFRTEPAVLEGYARYRVRGEAYPALVMRAGATTEGLICRGVDDEALARLDAYEGAEYYREEVCVCVADGERVCAAVYLWRDGEADRLVPLPWDPPATPPPWLFRAPDER